MIQMTLFQLYIWIVSKVLEVIRLTCVRYYYIYIYILRLNIQFLSTE